jgi:hypothetical protein
MSCPPQYWNLTCTLDTCPLECGQLEYRPNFAGNVTYTAIFGIILVAQLALGISYRTWGFAIGMFCGLLLEIIGYAGRIMLYNNPFDFNNFLLYVCLRFQPSIWHVEKVD